MGRKESESDFQKKLIKDIKNMFPGCIVVKNDPTAIGIQGFPDLVIYYNNKYAFLECKKYDKASRRPNQDYWVTRLNDMSFASFIFPENRKEVLDKMERIFKMPDQVTRLKFKRDEHAFLSASKYAWLNYTPEKLKSVYINHIAAKRGTELHEFACKCIELKQPLPPINKTLNMYVNDAIGFGMEPEKQLFYSVNCFGTADAFIFRNGYIRCHDLKTGESKASFQQLEIYDALFCLEYNIDPFVLKGCENRIYQNDDIQTEMVEPDRIRSVMDKIIQSDEIIERLKEEGYI